MKQLSALLFLLFSNLFGESEIIYGVMITGKDSFHHALALCSVRSFLEQTYPNKHLIIINDGTESFAEFDPVLVTEIKLERKQILGALRNCALAHLPENSLWIQWDDDDWHHPNTIQEQYNYLIAQEADMCCMTRQVQYAFARNAAWPVYRMIEGTILARKKEILYPEIAKGEDSLFFDAYREKYRVVGWNNPAHYYIRLIHGHNTWHEAHFGLAFHQKNMWEISGEARNYLQHVLTHYQAS